MEKYVQIGKKLADLHLNYEKVPFWESVEVRVNNEVNPNYKVTQMKHPKKVNKEGKKVNDLTKIIYNSDIELLNIPIEAYNYQVNGKSAIGWIIDQYQINTDNKTGIVNDPNEFSDDPKYILNLLLSIITVSMRTLELIDELPEFEVIE